MGAEDIGLTATAAESAIQEDQASSAKEIQEEITKGLHALTSPVPVPPEPPIAAASSSPTIPMVLENVGVTQEPRIASPGEEVKETKDKDMQEVDDGISSDKSGVEDASNASDKSMDESETEPEPPAGSSSKGRGRGRGQGRTAKDKSKAVQKTQAKAKAKAKTESRFNFVNQV